MAAVIFYTNSAHTPTGTAVPSPDPPFSVVSPAGLFTVSPGGQQPVTVRFSPATADALSGELSLTSNDPDTATVAVPLQGVGRGVPNISVAQTSLDFGDVCVGQSATRALTVHNTGTAGLAVNIPSPNPPFSVVSPTGPFTVDPGNQQAVTVRFRSAVGSRSDELHITSNDPDAATVAVQLLGSGTPRGSPCPTGRMCCEPEECGGCRPGTCIRPPQQCQ